MSKSGQKSTSLMTSLTKKPETPNQKLFFSLQTTRLAKSLEGLNSFLAQLAEELCCC